MDPPCDDKDALVSYLRKAGYSAQSIPILLFGQHEDTGAEQVHLGPLLVLSHHQSFSVSIHSRYMSLSKAGQRRTLWLGMPVKVLLTSPQREKNCPCKSSAHTTTEPKKKETSKRHSHRVLSAAHLNQTCYSRNKFVQKNWKWFPRFSTVL